MKNTFNSTLAITSAIGTLAALGCEYMVFDGTKVHMSTAVPKQAELFPKADVPVTAYVRKNGRVREHIRGAMETLNVGKKCILHIPKELKPEQTRNGALHYAYQEWGTGSIRTQMRKNRKTIVIERIG